MTLRKFQDIVAKAPIHGGEPERASTILVAAIASSAGRISKLLGRSQAPEILSLSASEQADLREAIGDLLWAEATIANIAGIDLEAEADATAARIQTL